MGGGGGGKLGGFSKAAYYVEESGCRATMMKCCQSFVAINEVMLTGIAQFRYFKIQS